MKPSETKTSLAEDEAATSGVARAPKLSLSFLWGSLLCFRVSVKVSRALLGWLDLQIDSRVIFKIRFGERPWRIHFLAERS